MVKGYTDDDLEVASDTNYVKFADQYDLAGLWGFENADGSLAGLSFIMRDSKCTDKFRSATGSSYSWTSPDPANTAVKPEPPEEYAEQVKALLAIKSGKTNVAAVAVPTHEHDEKAETGLVVVIVLVWVACVILAGVFIFMYCKER